MKYMKLGILPDTFYTEEAARTVLSDVPVDLTIQVNNVRYQLHKFPLLLKCGLLQRLCSDFDDSSEAAPVPIHDIPGGEEAFELCAKFCYGISIKLSAHNFVPAICAAKFLRMTESVAKGNFILKLESFFDSCILHGWKDPIVILQATRKFTSWSESLGIVHRCIDTIIQKILTHPSKVTWSYTYSRPGYGKKQHKSVPKDWWTEDVSDLDLDLFRTIISTVRSTKQLPPPLIGEALHVYSCKHLLNPTDPQTLESSSALPEEMVTKQRRILESIVSMIPIEYGSVSGGFMLRLLKVANYVGASPSTKAELVRRSGRQLHEVTAKDLIFPSPSNPQSYDIDLVEAVLEIFLIQFRRPMPEEDAERMIATMRKVATTIDSYLQVVAHNPDITASRIIELAQMLPELARPEHDELYRVIDIYLKEHPELSKAEKKQLCQILDYRKLSSEVRSHAIRNDLLPLRTIVQVLFIEQEKAIGGGASGSEGTPRAYSDAIPVTGNSYSQLPVQADRRPADREEQRPAVARRDQSTAIIGRIAKSKSVSESKAAKMKQREVGMDEGQGSSKSKTK